MEGQSSKKAQEGQFESEGFCGDERVDESSLQPLREEHVPPVRRKVCRRCGGALCAEQGASQAPAALLRSA